MNEYFINIKVDREEHPEIDRIYMKALTGIREAEVANVDVSNSRFKTFLWSNLYPSHAMARKPGFSGIN